MGGSSSARSRGDADAVRAGTAADATRRRHGLLPVATRTTSTTATTGQSRARTPEPAATRTRPSRAERRHRLTPVATRTTFSAANHRPRRATAATANSACPSRPRHRGTARTTSSAAGHRPTARQRHTTPPAPPTTGHGEPEPRQDTGTPPQPWVCPTRADRRYRLTVRRGPDDVRPPGQSHVTTPEPARAAESARPGRPAPSANAPGPIRTHVRRLATARAHRDDVRRRRTESRHDAGTCPDRGLRPAGPTRRLPKNVQRLAAALAHRGRRNLPGTLSRPRPRAYGENRGGVGGADSIQAAKPL